MSTAITNINQIREGATYQVGETPLQAIGLSQYGCLISEDGERIPTSACELLIKLGVPITEITPPPEEHHQKNENIARLAEQYRKAHIAELAETQPRDVDQWFRYTEYEEHQLCFCQPTCTYDIDSCEYKTAILVAEQVRLTQERADQLLNQDTP